MIDLKIEDYSGNVDKMLRKFKKKVRESKILIEIRERQHYIGKKEKLKKKRKKSFNRKKKEQDI